MDGDRKTFVCPSATGEVDGINLAWLNPEDADERRILIEAEHPEMRRALEDGHDMHVGSEVMNPRLHIAMHEIVANQIWDDDPPEMWQTAQRLAAAGHPRHDVLHMLASVVSDQVWGTLSQGSPFDIERMRLELAALPAGWEVRGEEWSVERSRNRAERRAAERRRRS
jgi:Domain of unknown function (DUF1841)